MHDTLRNADAQAILETLQEQDAYKLDVVAPAAKIASYAGKIMVEGMAPEMTEDGVSKVDGLYRPTSAAIETISDALKIHGGYLRKISESRPDVFDANVNLLLHGGETAEATFPADKRSFLLRLFRASDDDAGILRAMRSDRYMVIDNLDITLAALEGMKKAGLSPNVLDGGDLSERSMYLRVVAPEVRAMAPQLLADYRNPFRGGENQARWEGIARREGLGYGDGGAPVVFAGFVIKNSELGFGSFSITPRIVLQICKNGLQVKRDAMVIRHIGARMDEGIVEWSTDTKRKQLELVASQTADAVAKFLSPDYLDEKVAGFEKLAGVQVTDPKAVIEAITSETIVPKGMADEILGYWIAGGQMTAAAGLNAATAAAQTVGDADLADEIEREAERILEVAARAAARQ